MAAVILEVKNASFGYEKNKRIIDSLSLTARSGELVAILGPNGAGKTTLLRCIMGFLRWNEGNTLLDGKDVRSISQNEFWRRVSYVPQAKGTAVGYTAEEMILLGPRFWKHAHGSRKPSFRELTKEAATLAVHIDIFLKKFKHLHFSFLC